MKVLVVFEFENIANPDSDEATTKVEEITEACETMQVAFDANGCWVQEVFGGETDTADFALVSEYAEKQHALELEDYDQFNRDNTDPIAKITGQTDKL
jgi:hypothetical protein